MSGTMERHETFVTQSGGINKKRRVPESCIESTETILRKKVKPSYKFTGSGQPSDPVTAPAMYLHLKKGGNSINVNVSDLDEEDLFDACKNTLSYLAETASLDLLAVGEGACFIRNGGWNATGGGFNMHFLAVLKKEGGVVTLSDVSEQDDWDGVTQVPLATVEARTVGDLRTSIGAPYTNTAKFVFGIVSLSTTPP
jgi:hypothetical protein